MRKLKRVRLQLATNVVSASESKIDSESTDRAPGAPSVESSKSSADPKDTELLQSVAEFIQAQTDMMAAPD